VISGKPPLAIGGYKTYNKRKASVIYLKIKENLGCMKIKIKIKSLFKILAVITLISILLAGCTGSGGAHDGDYLTINVGGLNGPTGIAMLHLRDISEKGQATHNYNVTFDAAPDVIQGKLLSGEVDIAALPTNMAAVLHSKTEGEISIIAGNRLNVLYILPAPGVEITSLDDLRGKTVFTSGQGSAQEYVLNYLFTMAGLDPESDLTIEYKSEHAEVLTLLLSGKCDAALLPQPFVTTARLNAPGLSAGIDVGDEWSRFTGGVELAMSCIVARRSFIEANPDAVKDFISDYAISAGFAAGNPDEAAAIAGKYDILPEDIARQAIPHSAIACITGDDMKASILAYLEILHGQNPASVGGSLHNETLFYP